MPVVESIMSQIVRICLAGGAKQIPHIEQYSVNLGEVVLLKVTII